MMEIAPFLEIKPGVTALIGGGGKTSLLYALGRELRGRGRVILCTSTHIRRPGHVPVILSGGERKLEEALARHGVVCAGTEAGDSKLTAPELSFTRLARLADYVLVEADGSRGLPLKAHAPHEPVIPDNAGNVVLVVGADGFGHSVSAVCHRPERWAALARCSMDEPVTPALSARVLLAEALGSRVYINKVESAALMAAAVELSSYLTCHVTAGSLHEGVFRCLC